jgi:hypothetical protein
MEAADHSIDIYQMRTPITDALVLAQFSRDNTLSVCLIVMCMYIVQSVYWKGV